MTEQNLRRIAVALERIADALESTPDDGDPDRVRDLTGELVGEGARPTSGYPPRPDGALIVHWYGEEPPPPTHIRANDKWDYLKGRRPGGLEVEAWADYRPLPPEDAVSAATTLGRHIDHEDGRRCGYHPAARRHGVWVTPMGAEGWVQCLRPHVSL